ncbi:MAG: hypothetical protein CMO01_01385 [Thalassobius sp.]|nr:hypothetical protein [Thalassovita sp.]
MDEINLIQAFENQTLPLDAWTHEAHLSVAFYYLKKHSPEESLILLRSGIISYNNSVGTVNSFNSGYHETLTIFWIWTIANYINLHPEHKIEEFLVSKFAIKEFPFQFYSHEKLFSIEARAKWVEPDIRNLSLED